MEKKELLQFCRYYKGEKVNSSDPNKNLLFRYEETWIEMNFTPEGKSQLAEYIDDYSRAGLSMFEMQDNTPASLKALLFNRYCHYNSGSMIECVEPFKDFYRKYYK